MLFNVLLCFVADGYFADGTAWVGHIKVEAVLVAIQCHDGQLFRIICEFDARYITVRIYRKFHFAGYTTFYVKRMYANLGVYNSCFGIFVVIASRIGGVLCFFWSHTLIPWERVHGNLAFIEADVCNHFTICTEIEGAVIAEFFFIYPVGNTVEHLVIFSVFRYLRFAVTEKQFDKVDVVVAHKRNLVTVG